MQWVYFSIVQFAWLELYQNHRILDTSILLFFYRLLKPGTSTVSFFDVVQNFFTDLWDGWFGGEASSRWNHIRIFKKKRSLQKKVNKRDIILPSFGIAGDIVNDMANTLINVATVWKYQ